MNFLLAGAELLDRLGQKHIRQRQDIVSALPNGGSADPDREHRRQGLIHRAAVYAAYDPRLGAGLRGGAHGPEYAVADQPPFEALRQVR